MKKVPFNTGLTIESALYAFGILIVAAGFCDGMLSQVPFIQWYVTIVALGLFSGSFWYVSRFNTVWKLARMVLVSGLCILYFIHSTAYASPNTVLTESPVYFLYFLYSVFAGSLGSMLLFSLAFMTVLTSEFGQVIIHAFNAGFTTLSLVQIVSHFISAGPSVLLIGAVGIIPLLLVRINRTRVSAGPEPGNEHPDMQEFRLPPQTTVISSETFNEQYKTKTLTVDGLEREKYDNYASSGELSSVVFFMSRNFNAYSALGFIFDGQKQVFQLNSYHSKSMAIIPEVQIPAGSGVIGNIALDTATFMSGNFNQYDSQGLLYYSAPEPINSLIAAPILSMQNELLGALVLDSKDRVAFRDHHKDILNRFSYLAAALISNVRMRCIQERTAKEFQLLYEASNSFTSARNTHDVYDTLFNAIDAIVPQALITVVDYYPHQTACVIRRISQDAGEIKAGFVFPLNDGLFATAVKSKKLISIDNFKSYRNHYFKFLPNEQMSYPTHSLMLVPLLGDGFCRGVIGIESDAAGRFSGDLGKLTVTLISNSELAYQRAYLYHQMEMLATTDGLTQLLNHRTFQTMLQDEVARSVRYKHPLSLLIMDIDHFKKFNDTYGHATGDRVLREVGACIRKSIRQIDIPARYGGEEFAIILPETVPDGAAVIGERIRKTIETSPIKTETNLLHVTVSVGCANVPEHASDKDTLINLADAALYHSKETGRNRFSMYGKSIKKKVGVV